MVKLYNFFKITKKNIKNYLALGSLCIIPVKIPSTSLKYANQPTPGITCFGLTISPPLSLIFLIISSMLSTSIVLATLGNPYSSFSSPPSIPGSFSSPVIMSQ
jgi:hypothetical protein